MKKLSDYQGDDAIELWADLLDPITNIFSDKELEKVFKAHRNNKIYIAKELLKSHKADVVQMLLRIDPEPINGLNIITRLVGILTEIGENEEAKSFFGFAEKVKTDSESFGSATENTEAKEN